MTNILLLGSGGREHALAWKLSRSPLVNKLYIAPGNAGTQMAGTNLPVSADDFPAIGKLVIDLGIEMVVVGPEDPLVNGIHDYFLESEDLRNVVVIGPRKEAAQLEGSKDFAKAFMVKYGIPTARYHTFEKGTLEKGIEFLKTLEPPFVLKADGLAAGKGVIILNSLDQAAGELTEMLDNQKFGKASVKVVIEEFLNGIELSVFILTDGKSYVLLPEAKDYKRIGEGDTGLNTGGMGSISPVPFADEIFMAKVKSRVIEPTISGLQSEGIDYRGFIFFGLMSVNGEPYVIEYNCRLGDPETESVIPRIETDLVPLFHAVGNGSLGNHVLEFSTQTAATVMLVSEGYPGNYQTGKKITGLENISGCHCFHAGTRIDPEAGDILTNGGRVIAITAMGNTMKDALGKCYLNAGIAEFDGKGYRRDIGFDLCS